MNKEDYFKQILEGCCGECTVAVKSFTPIQDAHDFCEYIKSKYDHGCKIDMEISLWNNNLWVVLDSDGIVFQYYTDSNYKADLVVEIKGT